MQLDKTNQQKTPYQSKWIQQYKESKFKWRFKLILYIWNRISQTWVIQKFYTKNNKLVVYFLLNPKKQQNNGRANKIFNHYPNWIEQINTTLHQALCLDDVENTRIDT